MLTLVLSFSFSVDANAQGFLKGLADKAKEKVKEKVTDKVENSVSNATDRVLNGKKSKKSKEVDNEEVENDEPAAQVSNQKSDFVRGSQVFFNDDVKNEQVGEFPSMWEMRGGSETEISKLNGVKVIKMGDLSEIMPLVKENPYLKEEFTIEFDVWSQQVPSGSSTGSYIEFAFESAKDKIAQMTICPATMSSEFGYTSEWNMWAYSPSGNEVKSEVNYPIVQKLMKKNSWTHIAMSFNKRALKVYVNGTRVFNVPSMKQPESWYMWVRTTDGQPVYIKDVIMANGAVALYDKKVSSNDVEKAIAETGKFVTNNILFETGKADLKAESMEEIQKVADYMKKNSSARFLVVGHTDNVGNAASNQTLSENRAKSVVAALAKLGVDDFNLKAEGRGASEPVADNKTAEGKAKNRRVEFIKK